MQPQINKQGRTDYANQLRPRRHSMDGLSSSNSRPVAHHGVAFTTYSKPMPKRSDNEAYRVSININLPDYNQWQITKFARHYPYLSLGLAVLSLLATALFIEGVVLLWHSLTDHPVKAAVIGTIR